ncbi:AAA family ATPase [Clostridium sp.]|uniref:AAA family ATPase n=1 Tax=Clostridium sp. TaxID=1506 RepID=UPI002FC88A17
MFYNISKLEKKYEVKLDDTQKEVLSSLTNFIEGNTQCICLRASAGTGKTLILSILYDILKEEGIDCIFVAPTNKAKNVLVDKGDSNRICTTIHSLLNLRPNLNIMEFDASQLCFEFAKVKQKESYHEVLLIDECSMINDELYNTLVLKFHKSKIVFVGDSSQLKPIKQDKVSKTFQVQTLTLTKIYRQTESKLYKVLNYLRSNPLYYFKEIHDDFCNITICNNIVNMIEQYSYLFKVGENFKDFKLVKLITYTNNRINALNQLIRKNLYSNNNEYNIGELLTGYDSCEYNSYMIKNSADYVVTYSHKCIIIRFGLSLYAYTLTLEDTNNNKQNYVILSKYNSQEILNELACVLEKLRQKAVKSKLSKD